MALMGLDDGRAAWLHGTRGCFLLKGIHVKRRSGQNEFKVTKKGTLRYFALVTGKDGPRYISLSLLEKVCFQGGEATKMYCAIVAHAQSRDPRPRCSSNRGKCDMRGQNGTVRIVSGTMYTPFRRHRPSAMQSIFHKLILCVLKKAERMMKKGPNVLVICGTLV